jgi:hypothetical protein
MTKSKSSETRNILRKNVSPIEVGKYYLKVELSRIFPEKARDFIEAGVERLDKEEFWRFLEALSFSHRLNSVFWCVSDDSFSWSEERIQTKKTILTGMNPTINKIIYSKEISQDPLKFRDFLLKYFEKHKNNDDPKELGRFRPREKSIVYSKILIREEEGKLYIIDGMNRFIAQLLGEKKEIVAFIGRKSRKGKQMIGDSTFLLLRKAYERGNEEEKKAVLKVVEKLMKMSSDGESAVRNYWVKHIRDKKELKKAGLLLLKRAKEKGKE